MKQTLYEKILLAHYNAHAQKSNLEMNEIVEIVPDRLMIHDFFAPFVIDKFREMGFVKVIDPDKVVFVHDHLVPTTFPDDVRHHRAAEEFARSQGITRVHRNDGVCHQLMHELGYVKPGDIALGTDSHSVTYGAIGALATGIGYTEMAAVLGTGKIWLKMVPSIRVNVDGCLPRWVTGKDIILRLIADIGTDGATYQSLEFGGSAIDSLSQDARLTIANMSVEAGAKTGLFAVDNGLAPDADAVYSRVLNYRAEDLVPVVACPYNLDNVKPAASLSDVRIDQIFLGSCTNGRLEDLAVAVEILVGKKVASHVRLLVVPASRGVYLEAVKLGYIKTLVDAGAQVGHPSCSLCAGRAGGIVENSDRVLSTNNRNFHGRMGGENAEIYIASPAVAAASALTGRITCPGKSVS